MRAAIGDVKALLNTRHVDENNTAEATQTSTSFNELIQRIIIVLIWFVLSLLCAILVPNIGEVISYLGCLAAFFIFVFPGGCLISISLKSDPSLLRLRNRMVLFLGIVFVTIGTFIFGVVLTQDIQSMFITPSSRNSSMIRYLLQSESPNLQCY